MEIYHDGNFIKVEIPETTSDGNCNPKCPFFCCFFNEFPWACNLHMDLDHDNHSDPMLKPGEHCPRYKGKK